jgi:hypothetical protein
MLRERINKAAVRWRIVGFICPPSTDEQRPAMLLLVRRGDNNASRRLFLGEMRLEAAGSCAPEPTCTCFDCTLRSHYQKTTSLGYDVVDRDAGALSTV